MDDAPDMKTSKIKFAQDLLSHLKHVDSEDVEWSYSQATETPKQLSAGHDLFPI